MALQDDPRERLSVMGLDEGLANLSLARTFLFQIQTSRRYTVCRFRGHLHVLNKISNGV